MLSKLHVPQNAWANDVLYIVPTILGMFALGLVGNLLGNKKLGEWCAEHMIFLGFLGTLYGMWLAFGGLGETAMNSAGTVSDVIENLLAGFGAAVWTTITGAFMSVWLSANIEFIDS